MLLWKKLLLLWPEKRRAREAELEEELRLHRELAAEEAIAQGSTREEAHYSARRDLGSALQAQEAARGVWGFAGLEQLGRDCAYAVRSLRQSPSFTMTAILSLAIGIGAATAIFSLLNTILLKPLAYRQPDQLIFIREFVKPLSGTYPTMPVNYNHFAYWRQHARSFEAMAALQAWAGKVYLEGGEPISAGSVQVSTNLFSLLGVEPQLGRSFLPEEGQKANSDRAVITDSLWSRRYGRDPQLIGKKITVNYRPYTVVGILPADFRFPKNSDLGPLTALEKNTEIFFPLTATETDDWDGDYDYMVLGRLKPGISMAQATAELDVLERQIDREHKLQSDLRVISNRLQNVIATPVRTPLYLLLAAVMFLLLIVCLNLANLALARASARVREFSIRVALGAARGRIVQQVLIETLLLAIAGGLLGLGLAVEAVNLFVDHASVAIPRLDEVRVDLPVFGFSLLITVTCGLLSGLIPALRLSSQDSQDSLRAASHTVTQSRQALRIREFLIAAEVAISLVLLLGAGLMTASLTHLLNMDKGFTAEQAVAIDVALPWAHYDTGQAQLRFWNAAMDRLRSIPGVTSVAFVSKLPLTGEGMVNALTLAGKDQAELDRATRANVMINVRYVSPDYFATLGIPIVQGRAIEPLDRNHALPTVVSARLAAKLWPGQDPTGKIFTTGAEVGKVVVVGVVRDVHATSLDKEPTLVAYVPYWRRPLGGGSLVVRTTQDAAALTTTIQQRVHEVDPSLPLAETRTMGKLVTESLARRYFQVQLSSAFAVIALVLALLGIYGVVAYYIAQRRTEIALRLALGASRGNVLRLVMNRGMKPVAAGLLSGLIVATECAHLVRGLLFGITASDPLTITLVLATLGVTALGACLLPARRALGTDPATLLRCE